MTDTTPEKIDLETTPLSEEKRAQLRQLFPEAFTEDKIDFDVLKRSLGEAVDTDPANERFGLRWPGKSKLQQIINQPSGGTLVPQPEESVDWDSTQNMIIEGDNLEVLKLLQKSYAGKVKMIYIDPPYNTGNDFVYPDNYKEGLQSYLEFTRQVDTNGRKLQSNTESTGRYHANWLNMMYPRLYLARNLLRDDGVVAVSIDDHESNNLRALMNEVFGEENYLVKVIWRKRSTPPNDQIIGENHEYVMLFASSIHQVDLNLRTRSKAQSARYQNPDSHPKGPWAPGDLMANVKGGRFVSSLNFAITNPSNGMIHYPGKNGNWRFNAARIEELIQRDEIWFGPNGTGRPKLKRFLAEVKEGVTYPSIWDFVPMNQQGSREMEDLFTDQNAFESPKPVGFVQELVRLGLSQQKDQIVLDFFAGSGTTGHAVMQQNAEDGGNRRYIMVQLPEPLDEAKTLDDGTTLHTIADICRERVRRAGRKIGQEHAQRNADDDDGVVENGGLDIGFRAYKLAPSNFRPWDGRVPGGDSARQASYMPQTIQQQLELAADHLRSDATDSALLAELLLKIGFELTTDVSGEEMAGKQVYNVENDTVLICLDRHTTLDVIEQMAGRIPAEIICLDAGFRDDQTKVNAGQIIASHARDEETSIQFKVV